MPPEDLGQLNLEYTCSAGATVDEDPRRVPMLFRLPIFIEDVWSEGLVPRNATGPDSCLLYTSPSPRDS